MIVVGIIAGVLYVTKLMVDYYWMGEDVRITLFHIKKTLPNVPSVRKSLKRYTVGASMSQFELEPWFETNKREEIYRRKLRNHKQNRICAMKNAILKVSIYFSNLSLHVGVFYSRFHHFTAFELELLFTRSSRIIVEPVPSDLGFGTGFGAWTSVLGLLSIPSKRATKKR